MNWRSAVIISVVSSSCSHAPDSHFVAQDAGCIAATVQDLGQRPGQYTGRRVCVSGYFGQIVPHGEDEPRLYATREQAETRHADYYLQLGFPFTIPVQARIARYSGQPIRVDGVFEYDPRCWPPPGHPEHAFQCFPPRPMTVRHARVRFSDGYQVP